MTNEEFEREIKRLEERIEDQINSLRIKFLESKADKKPYEVEVPEDIENYYYVSESGDIDLVEDVFFNIDYEGLYQRGLAFKTKKEAEQYDKERILIFKMNKWAEEHNEGWIPNWKDEDEIKYFIIYDNRYETLKVDNYATIEEFCKIPYFKSQKIAEQFIEEFGDEIKEVFY